MNARRLAATETNMAYRTADYERVQQFDFVVGIEVHLSNNHNCKGVPAGQYYDICDELQGKYPKDFKFTGWHPHCRCFTTTILKTKEEFEADQQHIVQGEEHSAESVNTVKDVPQGFKDWVNKNASRAIYGYSIPYFMSDNANYVSQIFHTKSPSAIIGDIMLTERLGPIVRYMGRNPQLDIIARRLLLDEGEISQVEKAMLVVKANKIIADLSYVELQKWGVISEDMVFSRVLKNYPLSVKQKIQINHKIIDIEARKLDVMVFRDRYGMEFGYPVGVSKDDIFFHAAKASAIAHDLPPFIRKKIKRISFYSELNPLDEYWKIKHKNPHHVSAATNGKAISFWKYTTKLSESDFRSYLSHESAHVLDGLKNKLSGSKEWSEAVKSDVLLNRGYFNGFPTKYAQTNLSEDFAESIRCYLEDKELMRQNYPYRAEYIRHLFKKMGRNYGNGLAPKTQFT